MSESSAPMVCLSTAHPAKFSAAIREATGEDLARHPRIDALMSLPTRMEVIAADRAKVAEFVKSKLA